MIIDPIRNICQIEKVDYPIVGFGTYRTQGSVCTKAVEEAIDIGYRIIDTATFYENFDGIAKALERHDRQKLYLISKVWHDQLSPENLQRDLERTLKLLRTEYLDAYLIHWPNSQIPIDQTLKAMDALRQRKKIRHIGMSNVSVNHLKKALKVGVPITWVQIEMHPHFYDPNLLDFCRKNSIAIQAWRPLDLGRIHKDKTLAEIGKAHGKTACQIALRWIVQHGCVPLPGSKDKHHIQENFDIMDFSLSDKEMEAISQRAQEGSRFRLEDSHQLGFTDEFDFSYEECWKGVSI